MTYEQAVTAEITAKLIELHLSYDSRCLAAALAVYTGRLHNILLLAGIMSEETVRLIMADVLADSLKPSDTKPQQMFIMDGSKVTKQ